MPANTHIHDGDESWVLLGISNLPEVDLDIFDIDHEMLIL
jgi:hypothetical protein